MKFRDRLIMRRTVPLRVAIVLSGQPRTWRDCLPWWTDLFAHSGKVEFDVFAHLWNFNTRSHNSDPVSVDRNEMRELLAMLKPRRVLIEGQDIDAPALSLRLRRPDDKDDSACHWQASQFYSAMRAGHLKRVHEIEQGWDYDVCVKGRLDMVFPEPCWLPSAPVPARRMLCTIHSCFDKNFQHNRTGDIFYYGDSTTFDVAANFFRHLNAYTVSQYMHDGKLMPPEMPFHDYMFRDHGFYEQRLPWGPRLKRPADFIEVLEREGRGLGEHETF